MYHDLSEGANPEDLVNLVLAYLRLLKVVVVSPFGRHGGGSRDRDQGAEDSENLEAARSAEGPPPRSMSALMGCAMSRADGMSFYGESSRQCKTGARIRTRNCIF